jgi:hypothetical protein
VTRLGENHWWAFGRWSFVRFWPPLWDAGSGDPKGASRGSHRDDELDVSRGSTRRRAKMDGCPAAVNSGAVRGPEGPAPGRAT